MVKPPFRRSEWHLVVEISFGFVYIFFALGMSVALAVPKLLAALPKIDPRPFNKHSGLKKAVGE